MQATRNKVQNLSANIVNYNKNYSLVRSRSNTNRWLIVLFIVAIIFVMTHTLWSSFEQYRQDELLLNQVQRQQELLQHHQDQQELLDLFSHDKQQQRVPNATAGSEKIRRLENEEPDKQQQRVPNATAGNEKNRQLENEEPDKQQQRVPNATAGSEIIRRFENEEPIRTIIHEYGKSSCFTQRTRMVYPLSIEENGCYIESNLPRSKDDIAHPDFVVLDTSNRAYCRFFQLMINVTNIQSVKNGGENILDVIGQAEENEFLSFGTGSFLAPISNESYSKIQSSLDTFFRRNVLVQQEPNDNINMSDCTHTIPGTSVFVKRTDYVNLYHSMTNWFNIWLAIDSIQAQYQQKQGRKMLNVTNLIFLDAHPIGHLDKTWSTLFANYTYIQHYNRNRISHKEDRGSVTLVCFDDAVFVPDEQYSDISHAWGTKDPKECPDSIVMNRFIWFILDKFNCTSIVPKPYHIVYIDRKPYQSHPRSESTDIERQIHNLHSAAKIMQTLINKTMKISSTYQIVQLDQYTIRQQIEIIRPATILFGYHGAGLTHMIFMHPNSTVIEIDHSRSGNLFGIMANWMDGAIHRSVLPQLDTSTLSDDYITRFIIPEVEKAFTRY